MRTWLTLVLAALLASCSSRQAQHENATIRVVSQDDVVKCQFIGDVVSEQVLPESPTQVQLLHVSQDILERASMMGATDIVRAEAEPLKAYAYRCNVIEKVVCKSSGSGIVTSCEKVKTLY